MLRPSSTTHPASEFVLRFVGDAVRLGSRLVRPHEVVLRRWPSDGAVEVEVERIAVLGADVRVDLVDGNGERFAARLRREQLEDLELTRGEIVWAGADPLLARDAEADELFRSLGSDLDTLDVGATRAVTAEVDESLDGLRSRPRRRPRQSPSGRFRTQPATPCTRAARSTAKRNPTPWTKPCTTTRNRSTRRIRAGVACPGPKSGGVAELGDPAVEGFLALSAARLAPRTVEAYRRDLAT